MGSTRDSSPDPGRVSSSARPPLTARPRRCPVSASEPRVAFPPKRNSPESRGTVHPSTSPSRAPPASDRQPKLLDRLREALRARHPARRDRRTEQSYCQWACLPRREPSRRRQVKGFIFFHMECLRLRVHDVDFASNQIVVRDGKGFNDRATMLPEAVKASLQEHVAKVKRAHDRDLADGSGRGQLPYALGRKYPNAAKEWGWQFLFPQEKRWVNIQTGKQGRHHADPSIPQRAVKAAASRTGIAKRATCPKLRHSGVYPAFCGTTHPAFRGDGYLSAVPACASPHADRPSTAQAGDIWTIQELLGHKDVKTAMVYTHVLNRGGRGVRSPVDSLGAPSPAGVIDRNQITPQ